MAEDETKVEEAEEPQSCKGKCWDRCSAVSNFIWKLLTSHLGLFILLVLYTLGGASMMLAIEGKEQKPISTLRNRTGVVPAEIFTRYFVNKTLRFGQDGVSTPSVVNGSLVMDAAELHALLERYFSEREQNARSDDIQDRTYWEWMLFCLTVYTTIGYGSIFPVTLSGRIATMFYATIGVPLFLLTMGKLGKFFTRGVKILWSYTRKCFYLEQFRFVRKNKIVRKLSRRNTKTKQDASNQEKCLQKDQLPAEVDKVDATSYVSYKIDDEFNLHPLVAIVITLIYILVGCGMYVQWEQWSYYDAFYFIFISVTTIGLGDVVPTHPKFFLLSSLYILIGLALVAMVIHVLMEFFTETIHIMEDRIHIRKGRHQKTIPTCLDQMEVQKVGEPLPGTLNIDSDDEFGC